MRLRYTGHEQSYGKIFLASIYSLMTAFIFMILGAPFFVVLGINTFMFMFMSFTNVFELHNSSAAYNKKYLEELDKKWRLK